MNKETLSLLNFNSYTVNLIKFELNPNYTNRDLKVDIDISYKLSGDNENAEVSLKCIIFKDAALENKPFYLEVIVTGYFSVEGDNKNNDKDSLMKVNATAILFPYLRTLITTITSNSGFPPIIIPIMNVHKFIEKQDLLSEETPSN